MPTSDETATMMLRLLHDRTPGATICPSEVARALAPDAWRPLMPHVRAVARTLARDGCVELRQRGRRIAPDAEVRGPIRLALPHAVSDMPSR